MTVIDNRETLKTLDTHSVSAGFAVLLPELNAPGTVPQDETLTPAEEFWGGAPIGLEVAQKLGITGLFAIWGSEIAEGKAVVERKQGAEPLGAAELHAGKDQALPWETATLALTEDPTALAEFARVQIETIFTNVPIDLKTTSEVRPEEGVQQSSVEVGQAETKEHEPKFAVRAATMADIDAMVDVDIRAFRRVYREYDITPEEWREEMRQKLTGRLQKVGGGWTPVLLRDDKVVGFMNCCPTTKSPDDFKSWADTTDDGTLDTTYSPNGNNIYVVTLSVAPEGSDGKEMLVANQIGKMLREGYDLAFFESRMPGFRTYARRNARKSARALEDLSEVELDGLATQYFGEETSVDGKPVLLDPLLRFYSRIGCRLLKVAPNAYEDRPSMNYGVVCIYDGEQLFDGSVLPLRVPQNRFTRWALGSVIQLVSKSAKWTGKVF